MESRDINRILARASEATGRRRPRLREAPRFLQGGPSKLSRPPPVPVWSLPLPGGDSPFGRRRRRPKNRGAQGDTMGRPPPPSGQADGATDAGVAVARVAAGGLRVECLHGPGGRGPRLGRTRRRAPLPGAPSRAVPVDRGMGHGRFPRALAPHPQRPGVGGGAVRAPQARHRWAPPRVRARRVRGVRGQTVPRPVEGGTRSLPPAERGGPPSRRLLARERGGDHGARHPGGRRGQTGAGPPTLRGQDPRQRPRVRRPAPAAVCRAGPGGAPGCSGRHRTEPGCPAPVRGARSRHRAPGAGRPPGVDASTFRPMARREGLLQAADRLQAEPVAGGGRSPALDREVARALARRDPLALDELAHTYDQEAPDPVAAARLRRLAGAAAVSWATWANSSRRKAWSC
jgi:hypothetical protein